MISHEKFWNKVTKSDGCWLWNGTVHHTGYGQTRMEGRKLIRTHRASWILTHGEIPKGMCVLHRCDVRRCVNPSHLFLGTIAENHADMCAKGRNNPPRLLGTRNPNSKLTDKEVLEIRKLWATRAMTMVAIARKFKISYSHGFTVAKGIIWKQVRP